MTITYLIKTDTITFTYIEIYTVVRSPFVREAITSKVGWITSQDIW